MSWKYVQYENGKMRTTDEDPGGASNFADLDDVSFSDIQNGQVPKYNSETHKWENANESGGGGTITDVEVDSVSVVNQQGVAEITMPVKGVKVNGESVLDANKEAQIKSYKEVTQAQYEALPDSKLTDGILYAIKDGGQAIEGFPPLIYSSEEREIGVWCNGKPLYQKYITFTSVTISSINTWTTLTDVSSLNIEKLVDTFYHSETYGYITRECVTKISNGNLQVYSGNAGWACDSAVIYYTKTTDTPGSGTWTSQGTVAHHYSTIEHVVGTWTDGSPIYEKTIIDTSTRTTGSNTISTGISNLETLIELKGTVSYGSNVTWLSIPLSDDPGSSMSNSQVKFSGLNKNNGNIIFYIGTDFTGVNIVNKVIVILQYTKSTD